MCFRFARIFTGALAACTGNVGGDLLSETAADVGSGLSLLQLRAEKAAPSADRLVVQQTELIRSLGDDVVEAQAEIQEIGAEQANARAWADLQAKADDDEAQIAAAQQAQALALGLEQAQARVRMKEEELAKVEKEAAHGSQHLARSLPWASSSLSTDGALLSSSERDVSSVAARSSCRFTDPVSGISPGVYNKITQGITTVEDCQKVCEAEDACLAIVFRKGRSTCATLPRTYDASYRKAHDRAVVSNRVCGAGPEPLALVGAGVEVTSACSFSTPIRGKSPGSELQKHDGVTTLEDCQARCAAETHCLAVVHRHGRGSCFTLPRAYDENYEVSDDDAVVVNKVCAR